MTPNMSLVDSGEESVPFNLNLNLPHDVEVPLFVINDIDSSPHVTAIIEEEEVL